MWNAYGVWRGGSRQSSAGSFTREHALNTAFVERYHGTDRHRNGRKVRRTAWFSKDWQVHNAVTYFTRYSYNFWLAGTDAPCSSDSGWVAQANPSDGPGLADHVWSLTEWLTFPVVQMNYPAASYGVSNPTPNTQHPNDLEQRQLDLLTMQLLVNLFGPLIFDVAAESFLHSRGGPRCS